MANIQLKVKKDTHRLIGVGNSGAFGRIFGVMK